MKRALILAAAAGTLGVVNAASAQLVVGNDATAGNVWVIDVANAANNRQIMTGTTTQTYAMAADNNNSILYWVDGGNTLYKATMAPSGTITPVLVGTLTVGGSAIATVQGMAYDTTANTLVIYRNSGGVGLEGFYSVDVSTAACTLLHAVPGTGPEFGGFDYNPVDDAFYANTDLAGAPFAAVSIYRFPKPIDSGTATLVAAYPAGDSDIDGLAVGGNKLYLVNDNNSPPTGGGHYVYDLSSSAYVANIPFTWATTGAFSAGAWAPAMLAPLSGADVSLAIVDSPDPVVVPPGSNITYAVTVTNNGPEAATGVNFSCALPGNVGFVSADPPATHNAGVVTANIGSLAVGQQSTFNIVVAPSSLGTVTTIGAVSTSSTDNLPGNNSATASTTVREPNANLNATITPPADCTVPVGGTATYTFTLNNTGPEASDATSLIVTFPANVTFVSSIPPLTPSGNTVQLYLGTVNNGGGGSFSANFTVDSGTSVAMNATASSATTDPNPANNSANNTLNIPSNPPTSASVTALYTTIAASSNSDVPGMGGAKFATGAIPGRPFASPDGSKFIMSWDTDAATTNDNILLVHDFAGTGGAVVAQEDITVLPNAQGTDTVGPPYHPFTTFDVVQSINDAGNFVYSGIDDRSGTTDDGYLVKSVGGVLSEVAQENVTAAPAQTGGTFFGSTNTASHINNADNSVGFYHSINGLTTTTDTFALDDDGAATVAQEGSTVWTNQSGGTTFTTKAIDGDSISLGLWFNADHSHYLVTGTINATDTLTDKVAVVDGAIVVQENSILPGTSFTSPADTTDPINAVRMESDGTWLIRGDNLDDQDWVLRNGAVVAKTDDPIFTGSTENFDDTAFASCFFLMAGNSNGDYVVGGTTNSGSVLSDAVIVLNGTTLLARENDPVDLNSNGQFDDGYYIRTFVDDRCYLANDAFWAVVRLRDAASALCAGTDTDRGYALIRIPLPSTGCTVSCDYNDDGGGDNADVTELANAIASDTDPYPNHCKDFNEDGGADNADVTDLANAIASGTCP